AGAGLEGRVPAGGPPVLAVDASWTAPAGADEDRPLPPLAFPGSAAYLVYTSGSTGLPKGVVVPHAAAAAHMRAVARAYGHTAADRGLVFASLTFDQSLEDVLAPLVAGASIAVRDVGVWTPAELAERVAALGVTVMNLPTSYWNQVVGDPAAASALKGRLRAMIVGGEAVQPAMVVAWDEALGGAVTLINGYGPTEAVVTPALYELPVGRGFRGASVPIGRTVGGRRAYVLDAAGEPAPVGTAGELCIGGPELARGYLGRPALTAQSFLPDPFVSLPGARLYRTGDLVRWRDDGVLEYLGRIDQQVKIRGFRVEPGEVEAVLRRHQGVRGCAVVAREDEPGETRLVAYVVGEAEADALRAHLRAGLPGYMVPSAFVRLDALPLNANGKTDRRALPAPGHDAAEGYAAPGTPVEEVLAGIWAEVLRRERVGVDDDFFALGGHSLLATRVVSRVRAALAVELTVRALFQAPTVAELAETVAALRRGGLPGLPPVAAVERTGVLPLSFEQERLWFLDRLEPGSAQYNLPVALRLDGALDAGALERALGEVVRRHESLRTTFIETGGAPAQVIAPFGDFVLPVEDLSGLDDDERGSQVRRRAAEEAGRPFDLAAGPLFRATLLRLGDGAHVLLATLHHIVGDGWSIDVLLRETAALYAAYREGRASPLAEPAIQYADYAAWQREQLGGGALAGQLSYWMARLSGAPPLLELPTDHPRPAETTYRGSHHPVALPPAVLERLEALARREGGTLYMVLLATFQVLLGKYAGSDDVVVGSPVAGRTRGEVEGVIGCFVNTLVLRTDLAGDPPFREVLRRVREVTLGAYDHQEIPFEKLVEALQPERSLSHSPLFQVMFTLANTADEGSRGALAGLEARDLELHAESANFDLTLYLEPRDGGLLGALVYSTDLFAAATIRRMAAHLARVLEQVAADADRRISRLELMGADERARVLTAWNPPAAPGEPLCVHDLVSAHAARTPDATALFAPDRTVTFGELDRGSNRLARLLRARGVGHGTAVGVLTGHSIHAVSPLLAVLKAGGVYLPLHPEIPAERLAFVLEDAGAALVLAEAGLEDRFARDGPPVLVLDGSWSGPSTDEEDAALPPVAVPESAAYLIYTSGSTGIPKAVVVPHGPAAMHLREVARAYGHTPADRGLVFAALAFDQSVEDILAPLVAGGSIAFRDPELWTPAQAAERIGALGVTAMNLPTPYWNHLVCDRPAVAALKARMRAIIIGNEPLQPATVRAWDEVPGGAVTLINGYGPTETVVTSTLLVLPAEREASWGASVPIGRAVGGRRGYVLDAHGEPMPVGVPGELCVSGPQLARGYLGRPALTAEKFVPDAFGGVAGGRLYRTGDRVRWRDAGQLEFISRIDQQVKIRGFRVELGEIEATLRRHEGVLECCVAARADAAGDRRLAAYVVGGADAEALRAHLRRSLPDYMVPSAFVFVDALPLTRNGKVDRRALPAPDHGADDAASQAPSTPLEEVLAGIWARVLRRDRVGVHQNFFEAGGHSLLAMRVVSQLREVFAVELPVRVLFEAPTVAELAKRVEVLRGAGHAVLPPVVPVERGPALPLSFAQERLWFL
ncbi:MAG TPA: amino acid adenylation domain-containing protein, partial [Longimicrobium sp.]|nr:amino acid adenylation domain-containing protein [Longimicrobium sp.]